MRFALSHMENLSGSERKAVEALVRLSEKTHMVERALRLNAEALSNSSIISPQAVGDRLVAMADFISAEKDQSLLALLSEYELREHT